MLLVIDVGNTQTAIGVFREDDLAGSWRLATELRKTADELAVMLDGFLHLDGLSKDSVTGIAISSVVPRLSTQYVAMATKESAWRPGCRPGNKDRHANSHQRSATGGSRPDRGRGGGL